jgi:hypothetical protein
MILKPVLKYIQNIEYWEQRKIFVFNNTLFVFQDSPIHKFLFWMAISVLQLDELSLYAAGLALLEQNFCD